jgi:hypothetical protein
MSSDPVDFFTPGTSTFTGVEPGPDGRNHNVMRTTCNGCGAILSQTHFGCCGHMSCGFGSFNHVCKEKP